MRTRTSDTALAQHLLKNHFSWGFPLIFFGCHLLTCINSDPLLCSSMRGEWSLWLIRAPTPTNHSSLSPMRSKRTWTANTLSSASALRFFPRIWTFHLFHSILQDFFFFSLASPLCRILAFCIVSDASPFANDIKPAHFQLHFASHISCPRATFFPAFVSTFNTPTLTQLTKHMLI